MSQKSCLKTLLQNRKTIKSLERGFFPKRKLDDIMWAAYGAIGDDNRRTVPSAGKTYPITLYYVLEDVDEMEDGVYFYNTANGQLEFIGAKPTFHQCYVASYEQEFFRHGHVCMIMVANPSLIDPAYDGDPVVFSAQECGHISQNVLLMATETNLAAVPVGAFDREMMNEIVGVSSPSFIVGLMCIGIPKK